MSTSKTGEEATTWTDKHFVKFWAGMTAFFGKRWTVEFGNTPNPVWVKELLKITPQEAALGLQVIKDKGSEHPPSLPAFFKAVEIARDRRKATPTFTKLCPRPSAEQRASGRAFIAQLRKDLQHKWSFRQDARQIEGSATLHGDVLESPNPQESQEEVSAT